MKSFAELSDRARSVGIPAADLPRTEPPPHRRVPLEGGLNFRDLGGYPTTDGGTTRWGVLFRSDHLNDLTDDDLACVTGLGLRRVHDFRLPSERERQPSRLPDGVEVQHLAALDLHHDETMIDVIQDMLAGRRPMPPAETWDDNYGAMVEGLRPMFCALVDSLADASTVATPALFHCTGGKDRTGVAGVVLLELLGVPRELAIDDFLLTNVYRTPTRVELLRDQLAAVNITVAEALPVVGVTRSAITRAQHVIDTDFGGVERYVLEGGAQPDAPARLRELLVERS